MNVALDFDANGAVESRRQLAVERSIAKARARAEQRTALFIDATLEIVAERNSLEFTVQEVVDRTKLSLHAFYQLFESKDSLVEAVLEESLERGVLVLRELVDLENVPIDRLRAFVVGYFDLATKSEQPVLGAGQAFTEWSVHLSATAPGKSWQAFRPLRILAYELLHAAVADGAIRSDLDADLLAGFILSSVRSVTELAIAGDSRAWPSGEQLWQLVAGGVTHNGAPEGAPASPRSTPGPPMSSAP